MSRSYKNYYVLIPIKTKLTDDPPPPNFSNNRFLEEGLYDQPYNTLSDPKVDTHKVVPASIFIGSRYVTTLLDLPGVSKALQIVSQEEVLVAGQGDDGVITSIKLGNQSDAIKIGVFSIYSLALIPVDKDKTISPYNGRYVSRIPASGNLDPRSVALILYAQSFPITDNGLTAIYKVEPNSVKRVNSKKFSGTVPLL